MSIHPTGVGPTPSFLCACVASEALAIQAWNESRARNSSVTENATAAEITAAKTQKVSVTIANTQMVEENATKSQNIDLTMA